MEIPEDLKSGERAMFTAAPTIAILDDVIGRTGTMRGVPLIGKGVRGWEEVAQLGCC